MSVPIVVELLLRLMVGRGIRPAEVTASRHGQTSTTIHVPGPSRPRCWLCHERRHRSSRHSRSSHKQCPPAGSTTPRRSPIVSHCVKSVRLASWPFPSQRGPERSRWESFGSLGRRRGALTPDSGCGNWSGLLQGSVSALPTCPECLPESLPQFDINVASKCIHY
jgi:hypothetical protein